MRQIIAGLADKPLQAQRIIDDLTSLYACDRADISVMSGESVAQAPGVAAAAQATQMAGTLFGGALRQLSGLASEVTSRHVPGLGRLNAVGQLASLLSKSAFGTAGELADGLAQLGVRAELASRYAEAMRDGAILILVEARSEKIAQCARETMATHGATIDEKEGVR